MADTQTANKPAAKTSAPGGAFGQALSQYAAAQKQAAESYNTPEQQQAEKGFADAVKQAEGAAQKTAAASQDYATQLGQMKAPTAPTAPDIPTAPTMTQTDPLRVFGQFMPVVAMLGGALIKGHAIGAMQAAVAAGKAAKDNDAEALAAAHKQWQDKVDMVLKEYDLQRAQYDDALKTMETNKDLGMAKVQALAAASSDFRTLADLAGGNLDRIYQKRSAIDNAAKQIQDVKNHIDDMNVRQQELGLERARIGMEEAQFKANQEWKARDFALKSAIAQGHMMTTDQKSVLANLTKNPDYKDAVTTYAKLEEKGPAVQHVVDKVKAGQPLSAGDVQLLFDVHSTLTAGGTMARIGQVKIMEHAMPLMDKLRAQMQQNPGGQAALSPDQAQAIISSYDNIASAINSRYTRVMTDSRAQLAAKGIDPTLATPTGFKTSAWPTHGTVEALKKERAEASPDYLHDALTFKAAYGDDALTKFGIDTSDDPLQDQRMAAFNAIDAIGGQ